jgi:hypothetical protein
MSAVPKNEHEVRRTLVEDDYYPDHEPRTESGVFRATKAAGHKAGLRCAISGQPEGVEYHHVFLEWADAAAVDWALVKAIALGQVTQLPVLDLKTDEPTGETFPAEQSLIWAICKLAALRGFDWQAFDPAKPEQFVDGMPNMLVLHERYHRASDHGIHAKTFPTWIFQAWPRVSGFVDTPDEVTS